MRHETLSQLSEDYQRIEKAIRFLGDNFRSRPTLDQIAGSVHLSKYHFERLFRRWAGISPIRFLQYLTLDYTKQRLAQCATVLDATLDAGLSGPGRLHDLFVTMTAVTPGEFKHKGASLTIAYGFHFTPFGKCLLAMTQRGICHLGFVESDGLDAAHHELRQTWPQAKLVETPDITAPIVAQIFNPKHQGNPAPFHLLLKGTNFQVNVWRALLAIPPGCIVSYQQIAAYIGSPKAVRAAAGAIAANPVSYLIPCHRVITKSGKTHQYRCGAIRKKAILAREAAAHQ